MKKMLTLALAVLLCLSMLAVPAMAEASYKIGVCQLAQHEALDAATNGFVDALTEKLGDQVEIMVENASNESAMCTTIVNKFISEDVDLIMANTTMALQAAMNMTADIPILGTSVTDYGTALDMDNWTGVSGMNISGTSDLAPLDGQANMIKELFPDAKNVGLIYCSAEANSVYQVEVISGYLEEMGMSCKRYAFADSNDVASVVTNACVENDVLYVPTDNTAATCTEAIRNVVEPAGIPVVAGEEGMCSGCGVATLSINYYDMGVATGEMAYEILVNGADISTMPVQFSAKFTKKYNAELCEILGVSVPEDYVAIG